jgi:hypothetical protein
MLIIFFYLQKMLAVEDQAKPAMADNRNESIHQPKTGLINYIRNLWDPVRMTVFVVGTALIVFVAARNTVTWLV